MLPYLLTEKSVTVYINGKPLICSDEHVNFYKIIQKIKNDDFENIEELFSIEKSINQVTDKIKIVNNQLLYNDLVIDNSIVKRILTMIKQDFDISFMIKFLENLLENPSKTAINELYDFMSYGNLPITTDGHFLAYKKVRENYYDIHSGTMDNSIGQIVKMNREDVNDNREQTCSTGLHFCSYEYLKHFGTAPKNKVVVVKINPKDVVSIPADYNNTKGRCCRYEVVEDITDNYIINSKENTTKLENVSVYRTEEELGLDEYLGHY